MSENPSIVRPGTAYPWPAELGPMPVKVDGELAYVPAPRPETYAERMARLAEHRGTA
jgi:hypothetical protein